jgi:hypothetical protein
MPANLFTISNSLLPPWQVCLPGQLEDYEELFDSFSITALIGYDGLVCDYQHYVGILERDPLHLRRFFTEKRSIDQWHETGYPGSEFS